MENLGQFLKESSNKHKGKVAFEIRRGFRTERFTFADIDKLARKTASFLREKGLKKGDKVAIWATNMPEYPILYFGCWLMGVIAVPLDIRTTQETLKILLENARCTLGFKGKYVPGTFRKLVRESFHLEDLVNLVKDLPEAADLPEVKGGDLAEIAFTSGTTGTPKGVMLTHQNFLFDVESLAKAFPLRSDERGLSLLPLSHAFEQVADFLTPFQAGVKITYLERTNRLTILKAFRKGKITSAALVPQALQLLVTGIEREVEKQGKLKAWVLLNKIAPLLPIFVRRILFRSVIERFGGKLEYFGCGSAPLNLKLAQKWKNLGIKIFEGYGATETTAALTVNTRSAERLGSVGKVLPGMEVRVDPKTGEILAHGPNVSPGYWENPEKTKEAFPDGWYRTGDVGKFDRDGFLYITGREDFRIVLPNGQKVYPEDIERKLDAHPLVTASCVVGVEQEEGERVHAVVVTKYPNNLEQIIKEVNRQLSSHEQIMEWGQWKGEDFPRTPILKIDRRKVAETVAGVEVKKEKVSLETEDKLKALISQVTKASPAKIAENSTLTVDLKLDSLQRVELLSLIEQDFGVAIPEAKVTPQTTVADLRNLIKESPPVPEEIPLNKLLYSPIMGKIRAIAQNVLAFPLHALFVPMQVRGKENLQNLRLPAIFYFNHIGILDGLCVFRILPRRIREKLVVAAVADLWKDYRRAWVELFAGGFPFDKKEKVKASLELTGDFLDQGYSVLMAPEGTFTPDGKLLEFKPGAGFMAVEMQVPVVPIKIDPGYLEIFPPMKGRFWENFPKKRKQISLAIGQPLKFPPGTSYEVATKKMREAMEKLL